MIIDSRQQTADSRQQTADSRQKYIDLLVNLNDFEKEEYLKRLLKEYSFELPSFEDKRFP